MPARLLAAACAVAVAPVLAAAQGAAPPTPPVSPVASVVVLDRDAMYARSAYGARVRAQTEAALQALATENRRLEAELEAEERALTEAREDTPADSFRGLADAFDARVEAVRTTQEAKERAITDAAERAQALFFERAGPILARLARDSGALVILDKAIVIAAADQVDITPEAIARLDAALGPGEGLGIGGADEAPPPAD